MIDLNQHKLVLEYPCNWIYKVVIRSEHTIQPIIKEILENREHRLQTSKSSAKGKFESYNLELEVHSDEDRKGIYELLGKHQHIQMVV